MNRVLDRKDSEHKKSNSKAGGSMKKESRAKRMLAVALTIAMLLQNSASVLATDGAAPVSDALQEQSTELQSVNAASGQSDTGAQDGESADVQKEAKMSETQSSETSAPEADALQTAASETDALQTDTPKADIDETAASETKASETETSETATSGMDTPKTEATETDASETSAPQTDASKTDAPQTQETPGLTLPDSETDNEANDNELSEGTESGNIAETNTTETGNDTGTGSDTEIGNTTETEKNAETDTTRTETETMPTETTAQEQTETANANEADDSAETGVYTVRVENTSVQVKVRGEGVLPESSTMTAEAVATSDVDDAAQTIAERLHEKGQSLLGVEAFDITLLDENGAALHQLDDKVVVELEGLTVPEDTEQICVYHVPETGEPEQVKSLAREELADGILRFETDHFSVYAVVYVKGEEKALMTMSVVIENQDQDKSLSLTEDGNYVVTYNGENHWLTLPQIIGDNYKTIAENADEITISASHQLYQDNKTDNLKTKTTDTDTEISNGKLSNHKHKNAGIYTYEVRVTTGGETVTYTKDMSIMRRPLYVVTPNITTYYYINNHNKKVSNKDKTCVLKGSKEIKDYYGQYIFEWPDIYLDSTTFEKVEKGSENSESIRIQNKKNSIGTAENLNIVGKINGSKKTEYRKFTYIDHNDNETMHSIGVVTNSLKEGTTVNTVTLPNPSGYVEAGTGYDNGQEWKAENSFELEDVTITLTGDSETNYKIEPLYGTLTIKPVGRVRYNYVLGKEETVDGSAVEAELSEEGFPLGYMPQLGSEEYDSESEKPWIKSITTHLYRKGEKFIVPHAEPTSEQYTFIGWYDKIRGDQEGAMRRPDEECSFCYDGDDLYTLDAVWMFLNGSSKEQIYDGEALALDDLEFNFSKGELADEIYWQIEKQNLIELGQIQWAWGKDADKDDKATWTIYDKDNSETHPSQVNVGVYPVTIKANAKVKMSDESIVNKELKIVRYITIYPRPITIQVGSKEYQFDGKTYTVAGEAGTGTGGLEYSFVETSDAPEGKYGLVSGDAFASNVLDVIYYPKDGSKTDYDTEGEKGFANRTAKYTAEINDADLQNQPITLGEKECQQLSGKSKILQGDHDVTGNYYVILLPGELTITPADNTLTISKVVTGSSGETDKEFTFTVTLDGAAGGTSYNYYGSREGTISSGGTIKLKGGESVTIIGLPESSYVVTEAEANQDGYKTTPENASGTVSTDEEHPSIVTFTNSRDAVTPELTVSKTLNTNGFDLKNSYEFSFTLTPNAGDLEGDPVAALSDGKITKNISVASTTWSTTSVNFFADLLFTKTGIYTYTLEEEASSAPGIVNDKISSHTVTVTVSAGVDGSGTLTAVVAVDGKAAAEASFTNQYHPIAAQAVLSGSKVFAGALESGSFTFELAGKKGTEPMPESASAGKAVVTKEGAGDFQFGEITYTADGTYEYTIMEQQGTDKSVLYDATVYEVTVTVTLNETTGALTAMPTYKVQRDEDAEPGKAVFTNFIPQKRVTSPAAGESVKIGDEITYSIDWMNPEEVAADVTVTDVLAEGVDLVPEKSGGCSYDAATRTVTWTLENQAAGASGTVTLTVKVNAKARTSVTNCAALQVGNDPAQTRTAKTPEVETPVATGNLIIRKTVSGSQGETDRKFHFSVVVDSSVNGTYGEVTFVDGRVENIMLKSGESCTITGLPAGMPYTVTETEKDQDGYRTTSEGETGTIPKGTDAEAAFTNHRDGTAAALAIAKTLNTNGYDLENSYAFSFTLTPSGTNPAGDPVAALTGSEITETVTVSGTDWKGSVENILAGLTYTEEGTYTYMLAEGESTTPGIINDKVSSHTVTVTVSAGVNGSGTLTAVVKVDDETATEVSFTNQYHPTAAQTVLSGSKVFAGALESGSFTFELAGKKGTEPMPEGASAGKAVVTKEGAGDFQFGEIMYTEAGTYEYTITEQQGTDESVLYDATVYDVTVIVSPDETTGRLAAVPVYKVHGAEDAEPGKAVFTNFIPQKRVTSPAAGESVKIGDEITYSIDWMNPEEVAADVTVTDVLAEGVDLVPEKSGGCSYDAATRTVTWTFENQAAGETGTVTLTVKVNAKARTSVTNRASLQVGNDPAQTHTAKTSEVETPVATGNLIIRKIVSGNQGETDREFHFSVVVDPSVNGTYGEVTFVAGRAENIMLKSGESCTITGLPSGMSYIVSEVEANQDGYGTAAKNEKGTIPKNDTIVTEYTNRKPASAISLGGTKHYEGGELKEGQFAFVLAGEKDAPMPESGSNKVTNDAEGNFRFDEIIYDEEAVYHYTITEEIGTDAGILYDPTIYDVTVTVEPDSSTGYYKATAVYKVRNGKETQKAVFTNFAPKKSITSPAVGESVKFGDEIAYSISWMNPGETAADVTITDVLAEGVDLVMEKSSECSYNAATRTVTWALGSREAGASGTVTLTVKVNAKARTSIANSAVLQVGNVAIQSEVRTAKTPDVKTSVASGGLIVTKTVTGTGGDTEKEFDFTVTVDAAINGVYGNMTFSNGVSQFKLKHGGKMEATELPAGITYSVTESGNEGYTVQKSGENGTIKESETAEAKFVNNKNADPQQAKPQQTESTPEPSPEPSTEPESEVKSSETEASTEPSTEPQTEPSKNTLAKLTVTKSIVNAGNRHLLGLDGAHFYVALFSDAAMTKQVGDTQKLDFDLNTAVASVTYKGLKPGTYYVSEVNADGKVVAGGKYGNGAYTASYTEEAQKVTISKGDRLAEFSFENQFFELPDEQYYQDLGLPQGETEPETEPDSETESEAETETKAQAEKQTEKQTEQETAAAVPKTAEAVKTGDETPIEWMMLLLAISGMLMLFAEKKRRARS